MDIQNFFLLLYPSYRKVTLMMSDPFLFWNSLNISPRARSEAEISSVAQYSEQNMIK